eukprot:TRINITY_DN3543_c1_g1_i1.p1 TRINITY_DN3543_c1_g1~~TRINITY_DN3543_c1_g1_i1.p1  ORF type:complete len:955 (+),score=219.94 TRINITY_DN3543_c1_g1_i1:54-2918(+)
MKRSLLLLSSLLSVGVGETVVDFISTNQQLSKYWSLLNSSKDCLDILKTREQFTVFAPTNEAMSRFMQPGVVGILDKSDEAVRKLVAYHVAVGSPVKPEEIPTAHAGMLTSLYGSRLLLEQSSEGVSINSKSRIQVANAGINSNGLVHIVNTVLHYPGWFPDSDFIQILKTSSNLVAFYSTVWSEREALGLLGNGPFTVLIPSNKAFALAGLSLKGCPLSQLMPTDREVLIRVLKYHIIPGRYLTREDLGTPGLAQTSDVSDGKVSFVSYLRDATGIIDINQGEAKALEEKGSSAPATNGIYHVIDKLLMPVGLEMPDVDASKMRLKEIKRQQKAEETPKPIAALPEEEEIDPNDGTTRRRLPKKGNPLLRMSVFLATVFVIVLLIYRVSTPSEEAVRERDIAIRKGKSGSQDRLRPDYCLMFSLITLVFIIPAFPGMRWVLPKPIKYRVQEVSTHLKALKNNVVGTFSSREPVSDKIQLAIEEAERVGVAKHTQLVAMLSHIEMSRYLGKLEAYGLDSVDLIATSTPADADQTGIPIGHWSRIIEEARRRYPITDRDVIDITPTPDHSAAAAKGWSQTTGGADADQGGNQLLQQAADIAEGFSDQARHSTLNLSEAAGADVPTPPPAVPVAPPVIANPELNQKKYFIAHISQISSSSSTIECTFGTKHGDFSQRIESQLDNVRMVTVKSLREAKALQSELGRKDYKDVSPTATFVIALSASKPKSRFLRSFHKSIGKQNTPDSDFRCDGKMRAWMKESKYTISDYSQLPEKARALCEYNRNPLIKALLDIPLNQPVAQQHLEEAKNLLNGVTAFVLDDGPDEQKSMIDLMSKVNLTHGTYIPCTPYEDAANFEVSLRANDIIASENEFDRQLYSDLYHRFNTQYAGGIEMTVDISRLECDGTPTVCFDENDRNGEKKAKEPYSSVSQVIKRASTHQSVMCAGSCRLPVDLFQV